MTNWKKQLKSAKFARVGGIFNGNRPVYLERDEHLWNELRPQIESFISTEIIEKLIDEIPETFTFTRIEPPLGHRAAYTVPTDELKQHLTSKFLTIKPNEKD
jgi:hypothetical protein